MSITNSTTRKNSHRFVKPVAPLIIPNSFLASTLTTTPTQISRVTTSSRKIFYDIRRQYAESSTVVKAKTGVMLQPPLKSSFWFILQLIDETDRLKPTVQFIYLRAPSTSFVSWKKDRLDVFRNWKQGRQCSRRLFPASLATSLRQSPNFTPMFPSSFSLFWHILDQSLSCHGVDRAGWQPALWSLFDSFRRCI
jgi:hypothetical protein